MNWNRVIGRSVLTTAIALATQSAAGAELFPPNPQPGECYARVFVPPTYENFEEQVLIKEGSKKLEATDPDFQWTEESVLIHDAYEKLEVIPAKFDWVEETVTVRPASEKLVLRDASYKEVAETVMISPAYTTWKKGRGLIEKVDHATGEILCMVEVPAEYKTITKKVIVEPAGWEKVTVPAKYQTVKKRVVVEPAKTISVTVPAKFETIKVQKLARVAEVTEIMVPAQYSSISKTRLVSDGRMEWRSVLCETNARVDLVTDIQRALQREGYDPGPIDGVIGYQTMEALKDFQATKGLASGNLTMETIKALGVTAAM